MSKPVPVPVPITSPAASAGSSSSSAPSLFATGTFAMGSSPPLASLVGAFFCGSGARAGAKHVNMPGMVSTSPTPVKILPTPTAMRMFSAEAQRTKVLLLENVSKTAVDLFTKAGYDIDFVKDSLPDDQLIERLRNVHAIGIRSKTTLTKHILQNAKQLAVVGCFCIGTNQVDLDFAMQQGIPVFNSPFSNSRSVAELTIAEIVALARQLGERTRETKKLIWNSDGTGSLNVTPTNETTAVEHTSEPHPCLEIRGKVLGIIGYGHIGSQLSVLAEAMGMRVLFYDILPLMPLGTARPVSTIEELLRESDFVTLHVPATPETINMIREEHIHTMKRGSYLINNSRGTVVDIAALAKALRDGHLAGAAVDVYPSEPKGNGPGFQTELQNCPNTILSPHIGGSTEEAQRAIGVEVATAIIRYLNTGSTSAAVNFPEVEVRNIDPTKTTSRIVRILNVHENVPGVLKQLNKHLSSWNIEKQVCESNDKISYFVADITYKTEEDLQQLHDKISRIPESICTRLLY